MAKSVLTGIKPTGFPHLGNYVGAIRPALRRSEQTEDAYFFIADYHALNQVQDPLRFNEYSYVVAATWLACGLDPERICFYRQSDIPEVFELSTILAAFTPKGWMNKAHAYKAVVADNTEAGRDPDADVNMGLYTYPILMAADILALGANLVPVGKDQVQHVEIARDIAIRVNNHCGEDVLVVPAYELEAAAEWIPGLDGRKMSKSYENIIPLFATEPEWRKLVMSIKTDSSGRDEPKQTEGSAVFDIFASLAPPDRTEAFRRQLERGELGWGDAKKHLLELVVEIFSEKTAAYHALLDDREQIDAVLAAGAARVRPRAAEVLAGIRRAIGKSGAV